jgi:hypothetical protein
MLPLADAIVSTYARGGSEYGLFNGESPTCTHFLPLAATIKEQNCRGQLIPVFEQRLSLKSVAIVLITIKQ